MSTAPSEHHFINDNVCHNTAAEFSKLAGLRGITNTIEWKDGVYYANGENCGPSVHGLYEWLNRQPGVKP